MPTVRLEGFIELDGYFVALCAAQQGDGWWSWVQFEQDLEFGDGFTRRSQLFVIAFRVCSRPKHAHSRRRLNTPFNSSKRVLSRSGCTDRQEVLARTAQYVRETRHGPLRPWTFAGRQSRRTQSAK